MRGQKGEHIDYARGMFFFINALVWAIILCLPFLMATRDGALPRIEKYVIYSWIPLMFMLVFYLNYYFLVDKLIFEKRRWPIFLLCNFVVIVVVAGSSHWLQEFYLTRIVADGAKPQATITLATYIVRDGIVLLLVVGLSVALKMVAMWQQHESDRRRLENEKRDAELANLRSQLNPHFLFNTLNNIYGLTLSNGEKAREAILSLSSILRYTLYTTGERVPLDGEMAFIRSYVELMRLRTGPGMSVEVSLPADGGGLTIAPLMFMTLVENAFKHGISASPDGVSFVTIELMVEGRTISLTVANSDFPKTDNDRSGSGIGLDNLRRRLALLYPKSHELSLARKEGTHIAKLTIKL